MRRATRLVGWIIAYTVLSMLGPIAEVTPMAATMAPSASSAPAASPRSGARTLAEIPASAATLFSARCSTCHNIGGGVKVGPDLLGVTSRREKTWFAHFARNPSGAIDGGDRIAVELFSKFQPVRMPDQPLTDVEVDGLWAYFTECTAKGGCEPVPIGPRWGTDGTAEEVAHGRDLFSGKHHLHRGGPPCFACHAVRGTVGPGSAAGPAARATVGDELGLMGGGTLGPNVTFAYARLGEVGLGPYLAEMSSPVMHAVYQSAPLEEDEQFAVKAYLAQLSRDGTRPRRERDFVFLGFEGLGIVIGAFSLRAGLGREGSRSRRSRSEKPAGEEPEAAKSAGQEPADQESSEP